MAALVQYSWPGNIRELQNVIERAVILSPGTTLQVPLSDLPSEQAPTAEPVTLIDVEREHILRALRETGWVLGGAKGAAARLGMKRSTLQWKIKKSALLASEIVPAIGGVPHWLALGRWHLPPRLHGRHRRMAAHSLLYFALRRPIENYRAARHGVRFWQVAMPQLTHCTSVKGNPAVLRITVDHNQDSLTFKLEGRLAGVWVNEVERTWQLLQPSPPRPNVRFDLAGVTFVDAAGKAFSRPCTPKAPNSLLPVA